MSAADSAIDALRLAKYALDIATNDLLPARCAVCLANYAFCLAKYAEHLAISAVWLAKGALLMALCVAGLANKLGYCGETSVSKNELN